MSTDSIRYTTARDVQPGEELCIFYGHKLWFTPTEASISNPVSEVAEEIEDDGWGGLSLVGSGDGRTPGGPLENPYKDGSPDEIIAEEELPFTRYKLPPEEETPDSIRTGWSLLISEPHCLLNIIVDSHRVGGRHT